MYFGKSKPNQRLIDAKQLMYRCGRKESIFNDELNFDAVCSYSHHLYAADNVEECIVEVTVKKNGIGLSGKTD